jgi:glycosyltransferase involved in cell wall biosynthesis
MNICFLSETSRWGGGEVHTVQLAETLAQRGHEVQIVALGHNVYDELGQRPRLPFKVQRVPLNKPVNQLSLSECSELVKRLPADTGVMVRFGLMVGSLRLDVAARRHFRSYIAIEHSGALRPARTSRRHGLIPGFGLWWYRHVVHLHLRSAITNLVVCVSHDARKRFIRDYRVPAAKLVTIHNGIDAEKFRPDAERRRAARQKWGVTEDAFVFGSVGRIDPDKGLDLAMDAFKELVSGHPKRDLRMVLVGDGPTRQELQQTAREHGIGHRVVFAGFSAKPWEVFPGLDSFLLPTKEEALPLALMEAMASGSCPIAMAVGGVPEVLADARAGWLVPAGNRSRFLEAMDAVVRLDDGQRAVMAKVARDYVVEHFNATRQYNAVADVIEQASGGEQRRPVCRLTRLAGGVSPPAKSA